MSDVKSQLVRIPSKGDVIISIGCETCEPCRKLDEFMKKNESKIGKKFIPIDVNAMRKEYPELRIMSFPKILFMRDGKVVMNYEGFSNGDKLIELISVAFPEV